jgi:hypothetical protein
MENSLENSNNNINNDSIPVHSRSGTTNISNADLHPSDWDASSSPKTKWAFQLLN